VEPAALSPVVVTLRPPITPGAVAPAAMKVIQTPASLADAVQRLRSSDDRFRYIRSEVKEKIVYLRGTVTRWEDILELAEGISKVAGVERVILQEVHTPQKGSLSLP
jgi:hypothetical protein